MPMFSDSCLWQAVSLRDMGPTDRPTGQKEIGKPLP